MSAEHFQIHMSGEILADLYKRLDQVRWPECSHAASWERGTDIEYLQHLISYWKNRFDWLAKEAELNRLSHFISNIDGISIHYVYERSNVPGALPVILTHGWPDSFVRYLKLIPYLTDPVKHGGDPEDVFDVIIPSLPGFGFSGLPKQGGLNNLHVAQLWAKLMTKELGYSKFVAAGGDIGSGVTRYLALKHPELLYGIHLTDIGIIKSILSTQDDKALSDEELQYIARAQKWIANEGAYMSLQSTKPHTLAYGLSDSPAGLAAWIIEKFQAWSDCKGDLRQRFSEDELLTNIMIYWVTNTINSSFSMYYENSHTLPAMERITVPTGVALFPADILLPPYEWAKKNLNITRWTIMQRGGHFAAMEEPELLAEDIRAFCKPFRKKR